MFLIHGVSGVTRKMVTRKLAENSGNLILRMRTEYVVLFKVVLSIGSKREALRQPLPRIARLGGPREADP